MEMEQQHKDLVLGKKRKHGPPFFPLDELNQDLLERVLSWLPTSCFFRLGSVSKRWRAVAASPSFRLACSEIPTRDPWFLMVDRHLDQSIAFDTAQGNWITNLHYPFLKQNSMLPVASSGGLICFHSHISGDFVITNLVTDCHRRLPSSNIQNQPLHAISMTTNPFYKLHLVFGQLPNLTYRLYNSRNGQWEEEITLLQRPRRRRRGQEMDNFTTCDAHGEEIIYFLTKAGDVVTTNMQRSPSKQYSSVLTLTKNSQVIYFISSSGTVVACNLQLKCFTEYPRLLPVFFEYSIDLVECRGEMLAVVLWEFLETASLRVWRFSEEAWCWQQVAAMPPSMSHDLCGKKADINCAASGYHILICINSCQYTSYILFDLVSYNWTALPKCFVDGKPKEFTSTFSYEPRIEATV